MLENVNLKVIASKFNDSPFTANLLQGFFLNLVGMLENVSLKEIPTRSGKKTLQDSKIETKKC
jgi:hypothetical protein